MRAPSDDQRLQRSRSGVRLDGVRSRLSCSEPSALISNQGFVHVAQPSEQRILRWARTYAKVAILF